MLQEAQTGVGVDLYSPYPFPWRTRPEDGFRDRAWEAMNSDPSAPYYEVVQSDSAATLRYATADVLTPDCVGCHNNHPDTPRSGWRVGDVRGVLEITVPLQRSTDSVRSARISAAVWLVLLSFVLASMGGLAFWKLRHRTRRSELLGRTVVDTSVNGVITSDASGKIVSVNPAAASMFGWTQEELLGSPLSILMPEPHRSAHDGYIDKYLQTGEKKIIGRGREAEGVRKDGTVFPLYLAIAEARYDQHPLFVGSLVDITPQKQAERAKDAFVTTVSHELRTPLTSIRGALGLVSSGAVGDLSESARDLLSRANENAIRLNAIINDLLDMGKIGAGKLSLNLEAVSLEPLLVESLEGNRDFAARQDVELVLGVVDDSLRVDVDRARFQQVMANLVSNATKFSGSGDSVRIEASRHNSDHVRISVADSGPGIPIDFQPRVFENFAQADTSTTRKHGGTGLGLAISKQLVELHSGSISFESEEGVGTCFFVDLPLAKPEVA